MARWEVRVRDRTVNNEAPNWLVALGLAVAELDLDADVLSRMVCDRREDGSLRVVEPVSGTSYSVRRLVSQVRRATPTPSSWDDRVEDIFSLDASIEPGERPRPKAGAASFRMADGLDEEEQDLDSDAVVPVEDDFFDDWGEPSGESPPPLSMPSPATPRHVENDISSIFDEPTDMREAARVPMAVTITLLERGMEIAAARRPEEAADLALTVLRQVVSAEAGAVLLTQRGSLLFLTAQGPRSESLRGMSIPLTTGLAGYVATRGEPVMVHNVSADIRHDPNMDLSTGYRTRAMLAVPLKDSRDELHGCLQLLNPPGRFLPWHLEAAQSVAVALAEALRALLR